MEAFWAVEGAACPSAVAPMPYHVTTRTQLRSGSSFLAA